AAAATAGIPDFCIAKMKGGLLVPRQQLGTCGRLSTLPVRDGWRLLNPPGAAMQRIAGWLKKIGISGDAPCFAENRIDFSVLSDLTDQDLKDLGVVLGDRRKILRAIAALGDAPAAAPAALVTTYVAPEPAISVTAEATGERRYLTVMFCDLVG